MRAVTIRPRHDQIAELTRGLYLPLPEVSSDHLKVIAESLLRAFSEVRVQSPSTVKLGSEAEVTALMEARLNMMIEQDPLWGQLVLCVARGKESLSFDGSHLEKRPDLSIYLSNRNRGFPLITEAKIVDTTTSKTEALYCENGIRRFVEGEYAWGNCEAFMIAYVRDGSSIGRNLIPFLTREPARYLTEGIPEVSSLENSNMAFSRHGRAFAYLDSRKPGPISVWHLWLS